MSSVGELLRGNSDPIETVLVSTNIRLQERVLLLQVLHRGEILSIIFRKQLPLNLREPELKVLIAPVVGLLLTSLRQPHPFLLRGLE